VQDTLLALISLGYNREEAMAAIERTESVKGKVSSSELVKEALVFLRKK
jgi:Holliday junction resolvasome RuvABC DNA-binding subunit